MVKRSSKPRHIEECLKPFGVFLDKPPRLLWQFGTCPREVIKRNRFERWSGCQTKHAVSPDQQPCLTEGVLTL